MEFGCRYKTYISKNIYNTKSFWLMFGKIELCLNRLYHLVLIDSRYELDCCYFINEGMEFNCIITQGSRKWWGPRYFLNCCTRRLWAARQGMKENFHVRWCFLFCWISYKSKLQLCREHYQLRQWQGSYLCSLLESVEMSKRTGWTQGLRMESIEI